VEALRGSGDADRERADERARVDPDAVLPEEASGVRRGGRRLTEVVGARVPDVRHPQRETSAAQVPGLRVDDRERERGRDGGVDGVAAAVEDLEPDLGRDRVLRDDGALLRRAPERFLLELRLAGAGDREEPADEGEDERGDRGARRRPARDPLLSGLRRR
jgi:hypothetical protein